MKIPTLEALTKRRDVVTADLLLKVECADWHGVADAAMDLREIEAQVEVLIAIHEGGLNAQR